MAEIEFSERQRSYVNTMVDVLRDSLKKIHDNIPMEEGFNTNNHHGVAMITIVCSAIQESLGFKNSLLIAETLKAGIEEMKPELVALTRPDLFANFSLSYSKPQPVPKA